MSLKVVSTANFGCWLPSYHLTAGETFQSFVYSVYASRHWSEAQATGHIGHYLIALIEYVPVIGGVASLVERLVAAIFKPATKETQQILPASTSQPSQGLPTTSNSIDLTHLRGPHAEACDENSITILKTLDERQIPLHPCPAKPIQSYPINEQAKQEFLEECKKQKADDQASLALIQRAVNAVQHITVEELERELAKCVQTLNQDLANANHPTFTVGFLCGKSTQWVASLALKSLNTLPSDWFTISDGGVTEVKHVEHERLIGKRKDYAVIFDDCAYSGNQMRSVVNKLIGKKSRVFVVVPFMSEYAIHHIQELQNPSTRVTIITSDIRIRTIGEIFNEQERIVLNGFSLPDPYFENNSPFYLRGHIQSSRTLCYTDWRLPDGTSFISRLGDGIHYMVPKEDDPDVFKTKVVGQFFPKKIPRPYAIV